MMRAVVNSVEPRAASREFLRELMVYELNQVLFEVAARDARLIRDEDGEPASFVDQLHGLRREGEDAVARGMIDVADLLGDRAVAVDEDRASAHRAASACAPTSTDASTTCV